MLISTKINSYFKFCFAEMNFFAILIVFIIRAKVSLAATIAVVEYHPIYNASLSKMDRILVNTAEYMKLFDSVDKTTLDMIIFPEDTLRNDPETSAELTLDDNPCDGGRTYPTFIREISCAARTSSTYIVINLVTNVKCQTSIPSKNCQNFGQFFYNTDAIFDRTGKIVALYHKYNLFGEWQLDKPPTPEHVTIETDFGLKLGIFTCFDILFKSPAQDLLEENIDGAIFPSMWFSQLPFLTSLQTQDMWARAHNITIFASGANNPLAGSGGSGVYAGAKGAIVTDIIAKGGSHVYLYQGGESPGTPTGSEIDVLAKEMDGFRVSADPSVKEYSSAILDPTGNFDGQVCYDGGDENKLCCNFAIKTTKNSPVGRMNSYTYHMVAFSGVRSFDGKYNAGVEICGVIACLNSSLSSCGYRFPDYDDIEWPITFEKITIKAYFDINENKTQYPNTVLSSIRPIQAMETIWEEKRVEIERKTVVERTLSLRQPQDRILTFAIFGRNFGQDYPAFPRILENGSAKTQPIGVTWFLTIVAIVLAIFAKK